MYVGGRKGYENRIDKGWVGVWWVVFVEWSLNGRGF